MILFFVGCWFDILKFIVFKKMVHILVIATLVWIIYLLFQLFFWP